MSPWISERIISRTSQNKSYQWRTDYLRAFCISASVREVITYSNFMDTNLIGFFSGDLFTSSAQLLWWRFRYACASLAISALINYLTLNNAGKRYTQIQWCLLLVDIFGLEIAKDKPNSAIRSLGIRLLSLSCRPYIILQVINKLG